MKAIVYFKEKQRFMFGYMPLFLIMLIFTFIFLYGVIKQVILGLPFGTIPACDTALLFYAHY